MFDSKNNATRWSIAIRLQDIISSQLGISYQEVRMDSSLACDLKADPIDLIGIFLSIEQEFDIRILDDNTNELRTFRDAVNFVSAKAIKEAN